MADKIKAPSPKTSPSKNVDVKLDHHVEARTTAEALGMMQREISVAEFFEKNKHLLGYENPAKSLLTIVKEAIDNSMDACEEARILPDLFLEIKKVEGSADRYQIVIEDNGPGIIKKNLPRVFGKLLYGSKFHRLKQSLTADEPVLILRNGKAELVPIGKLVDSHLNEKEEIHDANNLEIYVPAFDPDNKSYSVQKVSHLIRHKREHAVLCIRLSTNRAVKVTGCHSLFTLNPSTLKVETVEARNLKIGDYLIVPRRLPALGDIREINILDYIEPKDIEEKWLYVYGFERQFVEELFARAKTIHKTTDKSRKYYRFETAQGIIDVLDDSMKQYLSRGFLPLHLVLKLGLKEAARDCVIRSYHHGATTDFPVTLELTPSLMRFFGLFVAEGHSDRRQVGFTFGKHETHLVEEIASFSTVLGLGTTVEPRDSSVRVKIFGQILSLLLAKWCGLGAHSKHVPEFVFRAPEELRKAFMRAYIEGDGNVRKGITYMTTVSQRLANELLYLLLTLGIVASVQKKQMHGLGKTPSTCYNVYFYTGSRSKAYERLPRALVMDKASGTVSAHASRILRIFGAATDDIAMKYWSILTKSVQNARYGLADLQRLDDERITKAHANRLVELGLMRDEGGLYLITPLGQQLVKRVRKLLAFAGSDLCLLPIKEIETINDGHEYVYDLSVPRSENFVGGWGGLACHNSRGQQGIGISGAVLYSQLTTGKPTKIYSRIGGGKIHIYELLIDVRKNEPEITSESETKGAGHGVRIEMEIKGDYRKGKQSVYEYIKETAIMNPYAKITFVDPENNKYEFPRAIKQLPQEPKEIQPHPSGVELGVLIRMMKDTKARNITGFLSSEFSRISSAKAQEICSLAKVDSKVSPKSITREEAERIHSAIQQIKLQAPPTDCLSPIGEKAIEEGLKKELNPEFVKAVTRSPVVYRGNPFQIEAAIAYGGGLVAPTNGAEGTTGEEAQPAVIMRFANKVPLLYDQSACAMTKGILQIEWRRYGLSQPSGALPVGPVTFLVHIASVWVPFTSEGKTAIASYPEILKEIKLALQDCGRQLQLYLGRKLRKQIEMKKKEMFKVYSEELAEHIAKLAGKSRNEVLKKLLKVAEKLYEAGAIEESPPEVVEEAEELQAEEEGEAKKAKNKG